MSETTPRILIVDDNENIHNDIRITLSSSPRSKATSDLEDELFGETEKRSRLLDPDYILDDAFQGEEAIDMVKQAITEGNGYSLIFIDVRMPPGIDGIKTIKEIWKINPDIEMVICTAFSDYSWEDLRQELGEPDNLFFLKKPFDLVEVKQFALTLTKKYKLALALREHMLNLESRIEERTLEIKRSNERLEILKTKAESASEAKTRFLSNVSHELRTPLNGIMAMSELILATIDDVEHQDMARAIINSAASLKTIIDDILDFSKIDAGKVELENIEFNINDLVEEVVEFVSVEAENKGVTIASLITLTVPKTIKGDPKRVRQILLNLLNNAVKFTDHGEIMIDIDCNCIDAEFDELTLNISVSDSGIGIRSETLKSLFEPFTQSETSTTRQYGGTGLGLSISKQLADLMGGKISVSSQLGKGSSFILKIPIAVSDCKKNPVIVQSKDLFGSQTLFIGDNPTSYKAIKHYMNRIGSTCEGLLNIHNSDDLILQSSKLSQTFDFLFIDYQEGGTEGIYGLLKTLYDEKPISFNQVVVLSYFSQSFNIKKLQEEYSFEILKRPIKMLELYDLLKTLLNHNTKSNDIQDDSGSSNNSRIPDLKQLSLKVLVADDNLVNREIITKLLDRSGIDAKGVENGQEAVEAFANNDYHIILMDCHMPIMDGFQATRNIRSQSKGKEIPIIGITADAFPENTNKCIAEGMNDVVIKPFKIKDIIDVILKYTQR